MESKVSKNHLQILKILHIGTLKQLPCSMILYIIHELHPSDVKVIFDLDKNPEKGKNNPYIHLGDCHPLHHESNYLLIVYCKRSDEEETIILCIIFLL
jgi:hypothetical protein